MESGEGTKTNPCTRSFEELSSSSKPEPEAMDTLIPREIEDKSMPSPKPMCRFFDPPQHLEDVSELKTKLESTKLKSLPDQNIEVDEKCKLLGEILACDHEKILYCLDNLGLVCAHEAVKACIENTTKLQEECKVFDESLAQYRNYLHEALLVIEGPPEHKKLLDVVVTSGSDDVTTSRISSKLHELLEIFRSFRKDAEVLCIVFVERIITAKVIARVVKKIPDFSHFIISSLMGSDCTVDGFSPKAEMEVLDSLHSGKVNLLFSTDVAGGGIHMSKCSTIVRFDLPKTVHDYIQSRGHSCLEDSQYIMMLERGNAEQIHHISIITMGENLMILTAMNKNPDKKLVKACISNERFSYVVRSTGASVTTDSSITLVHSYCQKLHGEKDSTRMPKFETVMDGNLFRCKLVLPSNAAFETTTGPQARNSHLSKQLVCLEACKKLHRMGALDDHLVPKNEGPSKNKAGSTKIKELHSSVSVHIMSGTWGDKLDGTTFNAYKMDFVCNIAEQKYSSFVFLLEKKLDEDVGNIEVELFLLSKFVKASVSFYGQISLDTEKVAQAKCFQELIFNGFFGKLFVKSSGARQFLLQTEESLWDPSNMYLLLPVEPMDKASEGNLKIHWVAIQSCVSTIKFLKKNAWLNIPQPEALGSSSSVHASELVMTDVDTSVIHLADRSVPIDGLKEMVVVAIHTGRIYSILDIIPGSSSESPFDGDAKSYPTFAVYYRNKYGIVLKHPGQPLLLLKQSHNSHNLLVDFRDEGMSLKTKPGGGKGQIRKPQQHAHMPPELLVGTDLRTDISKSIYLLPSVMHRFESLMLASQLREEISRHTGHFNVSSSLILEALTTMRCCESFSMERLELLGDSVLKYAVSCHLFLKNPKKHEGYLSSRRSQIVGNASLHKLGTSRKVQEYIRDCPFDPRRWTAPGQRAIWPSPCKHGVNTKEVPLDDKFFSEDTNLQLGKACDKGHRWMGSKTISDCVEALIGAYYVGGGLVAAISFLKWLGVEAQIDFSLIHDSIKVASLHSYSPKVDDITVLEAKLGYQFSTKGLLLEAITHETKSGQGVGYCYERLEFLGDSVLDILITQHLYNNHKNLDPGELTDLRSASVNNDNFAIVAVRRNLHPHLMHSSSSLENQISVFVKLVSDLNGNVLAPDTKGPKVLGDLVESIAGAVLLDSKLNLEEVWKVFEPILSPIMTPDKLELPPSRELIELCDSLGYFFKEQFTTKGGVVHTELKLQLETVLLDGQGSGPTRKAAKGMAALQVLKKLEARGILSSSKRRKYDKDSSNCDADVSNESESEASGSAPKRHKPVDPQPEMNISSKDSSKIDIPVLPPIDTKKGGPRNALYALCKKQQWPMPTFETTEQKFRTAIQLGDTTGFNSFKSQICLIIPGFDRIEATGEERADKKSSFDSAALVMLFELKRHGKIAIG